MGYCSVADRDSLKLPDIKEGVYDQSSGLKDEIDDDARAQLNVIYARDYSISKDFNILQRTLLKR